MCPSDDEYWLYFFLATNHPCEVFLFHGSLPFVDGPCPKDNVKIIYFKKHCINHKEMCTQRLKNCTKHLGGGGHKLFLKRIDYLEKQHKILEKN